MDNVLAFGAASAEAGRIDAVFLLITVVGGFFFLLTQGLLIYFAVRYRRRSADRDNETPYITGDHLLEFFWVLIPSIVVVAIFYYGWRVYDDLRVTRPDATEVYVTGKQWMWEVRYPDGRTGINEIRVPLGKPVKFILTGADVIHGFYLPDFRVKMDAIPGRLTALWVQPDRAGEYPIYCTVYCGDGHSNMNARLIVMPPEQYVTWAAGEEEHAEGEEQLTLHERGERIVGRAGCLNCHAVAGKEKVGPNFHGVYGSTVPLADGKSVKADEEYLRESIVDPGAKVVKGYPNVMPTYKTTLKPGEIEAVVEFLKKPD
jgi:cytochrome c oxidase subunit 2